MHDAAEVNFDTIVGPTHHYAGLGVGNFASLDSSHRIAHPKAAALEGLNKMWLLHSLGIPQAVLPPPKRPNSSFLRQTGWSCEDQASLKPILQAAPKLLQAACSASAMWTANAATVSPSPDCRDGRLHITIANLISSLHRAPEADERLKLFQFIFSDKRLFDIHPPLPAAWPLRDEGAANHLRLCRHHGETGIEIFVDGTTEGESQSILGNRGAFPRHTRLASQTLAKLHQLERDNTFFLTQNPEAIGLGVFHNDVISTSHRHLMLHHELAFVDDDTTWQKIQHRFRELTGGEITRIVVSNSDLTIKEAVASYLFNSQIVDPPENSNERSGWHLIAPQQSKDCIRTRKVIESWIADAGCPIDHVHYVALGQSMANGGGPACLRLRVVMSHVERQAIQLGFWLDQGLFNRLENWMNTYYPDKLAANELAEPDIQAKFEKAFQQLENIFPYCGQ